MSSSAKTLWRVTACRRAWNQARGPRRVTPTKSALAGTFIVGMRIAWWAPWTDTQIARTFKASVMWTPSAGPAHYERVHIPLISTTTGACTAQTQPRRSGKHGPCRLMFLGGKCYTKQREKFFLSLRLSDDSPVSSVEGI